jgi:hypothetical protein
MIRPEDMPIEVSEVPQLIAEVKAFIGNSALEAKLARVERALKLVGPVTREYWVKPNTSVWTGIAAERIPSTRALLETVSPIHEAARLGAILRILEATMPDWKKADIRSRLLNDDVLAPILIELTAASRYAALGFDVRWIEPDPVGERKTFDLLIQRGDLAFEIECKAKSIDAGRKVARLKLYQLCDRLPGSVTSRPFPSGFRAIDIRVPNRIPTSNEWQQLVISALEDLRTGGSLTLSDGTCLKVSLRDLSHRDVAATALELRLEGPFVQRVLISDDPDVFARPLMVMRLWSERQDRVVADIQDDLIGALDQLSGSLPGNIVCYVPEITSFQGCQNPRSAVATMSRAVFARRRADRLVSIDFVSDPVVRHIPGLSVGMHVENLRFQNYRIDPASVPTELRK